ncbi:MAG: SDR family NAD(P)-dependent oxidoreductase [Acidimicrobiales bacterium]
MSGSLVWISGASSGIGLALAASVPWSEARVIGISRRPPPGNASNGSIEHLRADLADPAGWQTVGASFRAELGRLDPERVVFVHAAGTLEPVGFAGEVETEAYASNVVLNSAAAQVLGHMFLAAVAPLAASQRHLVMISSGAARSVYAGWSSYGAGKAAMDCWVRNVGAEQAARGGVRVWSVAPGTVDTGMQDLLRHTAEADFPARSKFVELHATGGLAQPAQVADRIWALLDQDLPNGTVLDLRDHR